MARSRRSELLLISQSKSTFLLTGFLVVYTYLRLRPIKTVSGLPTKRPPSKNAHTGPDLADRSSENDEIDHSCAIDPIGNDVFDRDFANFRSPHKPFAAELRAIIHILAPSFRAKIIRYLLIHVLLLGLRTYLSLVVANLDGKIVKHLIDANGPAFGAGLVEWLALAMPASYTNATIRYLEGKISLEFRKSLVRYVHDIYVSPDHAYYKINSTDGSLLGVDHRITNDITKFCHSASRLYANLGKPALDLCIFSYQLSRNLGKPALMLIFLNYLATAVVLRQTAPAFGKLAARGAALEGYYRNAYSRVIENAEEIAFYDGAHTEKQSLTSQFAVLYCHLAKVAKLESLYAIFESYVLKYSWSASGYLFASIPVYLPQLISANATKSGFTQPALQASEANFGNHRGRGDIGTFITNKRIMMSISDAGGRIMYSLKDIAEFSGYTRRVYELLSALHRVRKQAYSRAPLDRQKSAYTMADVRGQLELTNEPIFSLRGVPVVVPGLGGNLVEGEILLDPVTLELQSGKHLLIFGSNGTGKSSISRIAAGLWPVYRGLLKRSKSVSFLPQRPYFSHGTLRDQILYPLTSLESVERGITDDDLQKILQRVHLEYLPHREGGMNITKEWKDILSGGEKQRMLFARVLLQNPKFAVIDEGTSAVSADMEGQLYEECKSQGITLITISHRISLLKYHDCKLELGLGKDGRKWVVNDTSSRSSWHGIDTEIKETKEFLENVPNIEARYAEVERLLSY